MPSARTRETFIVAAMLAVIAAVLVFGYRSGPAPARASTTTAITAAAYDLDLAMKLAGEQVPPDIESYYFFAFVDPAESEHEIGELAEKLAQAAQEHDFLGISGPDSERNRRNLLAALRVNQGRDLSGAVIIYVGPLAQRVELGSAVQATGAQLRFVEYPPATPTL